MSTISILLVDDHPIVREGYRRLFESRPRYAVCAEVENANQAYIAYKAHKPSIVIMDLTLVGVSGIEAVRRICEFDKEAKVLIFSMHAGTPFALKAFEAGARGYVTKSSPPAELSQAVETIVGGGLAMSHDISCALASERLSATRQPIDELSPREMEILRLLATGVASETIADMLNLSHKTVRNVHYAVKAKLGAQNDAHLVWLALAAGLVSQNALNA